MPISTISVSELHQSLHQNHPILLIDVREHEEWNTGHIQGAKHLPLKQIEDGIKMLAPSNETTLYLQCRSGARSEQAAMQLKALGYKNVFNVEGGIMAWRAAQLPVALPLASADETCSLSKL